MRKFYEALLDRFRLLHGTAMQALDLLPAEALDWVPGPEMNSITVLVTHFTAAERYYIGDVVRGEPSFRVREAEFAVKGSDAASLKQRIADLDAYEERVFDSLRVRDLEVWKVSPVNGKKMTVAWSLLHALEHTAVHIGHIEILVQQWKAKEKV